DAINSRYLNVAHNVIGISRIMAHFISYFLQQLYDSIARFTVGDGHTQGKLRPITSCVRDDLDFSVGEKMNRYVLIAKLCVEQSHSLVFAFLAVTEVLFV